MAPREPAWKDATEDAVGFFNAGERARFFGKYGALWGGVFGMLLAAFLFVPVLGHIVVLGPLASTVVGGLEGAAVAAIRADKFLLVVHGDAKGIQRAREVLAATDLSSFNHHAASGSTTAPSATAQFSTSTVTLKT